MAHVLIDKAAWFVSLSHTDFVQFVRNGSPQVQKKASSQKEDDRRSGNSVHLPVLQPREVVWCQNVIQQIMAIPMQYICVQYFFVDLRADCCQIFFCSINRERSRNTGIISCTVCLEEFQTPITCILIHTWILDYMPLSHTATKQKWQ